LDPKVRINRIQQFLSGCSIWMYPFASNASSPPVVHLYRDGSTGGELTSLLSSEIEINKCNVQCCVYITDGGKWRLCQNIVLNPIAFDSESTTRLSIGEMARNSKKKLAIFAGTSKCLVYVSCLVLHEWMNARFSQFLFYNSKNCTSADAVYILETICLINFSFV